MNTETRNTQILLAWKRAKRMDAKLTPARFIRMYTGYQGWSHDVLRNVVYEHLRQEQDDQIVARFSDTPAYQYLLERQKRWKLHREHIKNDILGHPYLRTRQYELSR